jgi:hypothetical protein
LEIEAKEDRMARVEAKVFQQKNQYLVICKSEGALGKGS